MEENKPTHELPVASLTSGDVDEANMEIELPTEVVAQPLDFHLEDLDPLDAQRRLYGEQDLYNFDTEEEFLDEAQEYLGSQQ